MRATQELTLWYLGDGDVREIAPPAETPACSDVVAAICIGQAGATNQCWAAVAGEGGRRVSLFAVDSSGGEMSWMHQTSAELLGAGSQITQFVQSTLRQAAETAPFFGAHADGRISEWQVSGDSGAVVLRQFVCPCGPPIGHLAVSNSRQIAVVSAGQLQLLDGLSDYPNFSAAVSVSTTQPVQGVCWIEGVHGVSTLAASSSTGLSSFTRSCNELGVVCRCLVLAAAPLGCIGTASTDRQTS